MQATILKQSFFRFFLFVGLAAAMVACKKDKDSNGPDPVPTGVKLQQYTNGENYIRFTYNADGTVQKVVLKDEDNNSDDGTTYTVAFDAQKKISSLTSQWQKIEVEYQNNVISRTKMFENGRQLGYTDYTFENGNLKKAILYFGESGTFVPVFQYEMSYNAQGNLSQSIIKMATNEPDQMIQVGHTTYEYDQKTNPLYQHKELMALFWQAASKNNITVENEFDEDQQPSDKFTYTYTYKANGLPEKATVKQGLPGQEPVTSQVTFTYQ